MEAMVGAALMGPTVSGAALTGGSMGLFGSAGAFGAGGLLTGGSSLLTGLMTGASMFGSIAGGNMQADIMNMQAQQADINARMETLKGREEALTIRRRLESDLASQNALFTARGVLQGEGSAAAAVSASKKAASEDIEVAQFGAAMGSETQRMQAAQYRIQGKTARTAGFMEAGNTLMNSRNARNAFSLLSGI